MDRVMQPTYLTGVQAVHHRLGQMMAEEFGGSGGDNHIAHLLYELVRSCDGESIERADVYDILELTMCPAGESPSNEIVEDVRIFINMEVIQGGLYDEIINNEPDAIY